MGSQAFCGHVVVVRGGSKCIYPVAGFYIRGGDGEDKEQLEQGGDDMLAHCLVGR